MTQLMVMTMIMQVKKVIQTVITVTHLKLMMKTEEKLKEQQEVEELAMHQRGYYTIKMTMKK